MEGLLLRQDMGKNHGLVCCVEGRATVVSYLTGFLYLVPTLITSDSLNRKVSSPSSIDSVFNLSAAEITLGLCTIGAGILWGEMLKRGIMSVPSGRLRAGGILDTG